MKTENKLIAEFMGKEIYQNYHESNYHCSWDWLMPVVDEAYEKIKGNMFPYYKLVMAIEDGLRERNREDVYNAVVEFINEYNKNK